MEEEEHMIRHLDECEARRLTGIIAVCVVAAMSVVLLPWVTTSRAATKSAALTKVTFQGTADLGTLSLLLGKQQGFFKKNGIDVDVKADGTPAQILPSLLGGRAQFTIFTWTSLAPVAANNVPIVGITNLTALNDKKARPDFVCVTRADSGIRSIRDVPGKTIGITTLNSTQEITMRYLAAKAGVDQKSLKFVVVANQDGPSALANKRVDLLFVIEPYLTKVRQRVKIRELFNPAEVVNRLSQFNVITSRSYLSSHPAVVSSFRRAAKQSVEFARTHPKSVRALVPKVIGLTPREAKVVRLPTYDADVDLKKVQRWIKISYNLNKIASNYDITKAAVLK
jgi:NitT/TauT family transport system substrate-binding protein